ncbi:hypothetical protein SEUCBS140593_009128 [Sporothrix eucalyptigena]|uniref:Uncharacterized protein n=1 Tax=Sporothrix eucalyptigena TaxID=1812306 RepID=A0ABP0CUV8_9PEZI
MRVLSLAFGVAAAASLALGNPCRPSHGVSSTTSSSAVPSSSASSVSSSSSISSTSSSAVAIATFNIEVNGQLLKTYPLSSSHFAALTYGDSSDITSEWTVNPLSLQTGTNYLMVGSTNVVYSHKIGILYTDSSISTTGSSYTPLICSDIYEGVALSCYLSDSPTYTNFYVATGYGFTAISMFDPNSPPAGAVTIQLIPVPPN